MTEPLFDLAACLAAAPPQSAVKTLPGSGFAYLPYDEVCTALDSIFGPMSWSYEIISSQFIGERDCKIKSGDAMVDGYTVLIQVHGRLTVSHGEQIVVRDGLATGSGQFKKGYTPDKAYSDAAGEAATDALKRAAKTLGNAFGRAIHSRPSNGNGNGNSRASSPSHSSHLSHSSSTRRGSAAGTIRHHAKLLHGDQCGDYLTRTLAAAKVSKIEDLPRDKQTAWADALDQELKSRAASKPLEVQP